jgi:hypothetical protein
MPGIVVKGDGFNGFDIRCLARWLVASSPHYWVLEIRCDRFRGIFVVITGGNDDEETVRHQTSQQGAICFWE